MADVLLQLAAAFEAAGTGNLVTIAAAQAIDLSNGLVLGDAESGAGGTGIGLSTEARMRDKPSTPGSVTRADDFYVQEDISSYSMAYILSGNRRPRPGTPASDGSDFRPDLGYVTLLNAAGLIESTGDATGLTYVPGTALAMDSMVWDGGNPGGNKVGVRNLVQEALINTLTLQFDAGSPLVATADIAGALTPDGSGGFTRELGFPAPDYEEQASVSPPIIASANPLWNATERCFQTLTVTVDNAIQDVQSSCGIDGFRRLPTLPRTISVSGSMIVNDQDFDAEWDAMTRGTTANATYNFTAGQAAGSAEPMSGVQIFLNGIRVTSHEVQEVDETGLRGIAFEGYCSSDTPGAEFALKFI